MACRNLGIRSLSGLILFYQKGHYGQLEVYGKPLMFIRGIAIGSHLHLYCQSSNINLMQI
jgi:hypothetical protein